MGDMIERMVKAGNEGWSDQILLTPVDDELARFLRAALRAVTASDISDAVLAAFGLEMARWESDHESHDARTRRALAAAMQKASEE